MYASLVHQRLTRSGGAYFGLLHLRVCLLRLRILPRPTITPGARLMTTQPTVNLVVGVAQYYMSGRKDDLKGQISVTVKQLEEYNRQGPSVGGAAVLAQRIASHRKKELDEWKDNLRLAA